MSKSEQKRIEIQTRGSAAAARRPHKPEVAGSSPALATTHFVGDRCPGGHRDECERCGRIVKVGDWFACPHSTEVTYSFRGNFQ